MKMTLILMKTKMKNRKKTSVSSLFFLCLFFILRTFSNEGGKGGRVMWEKFSDLDNRVKIVVLGAVVLFVVGIFWIFHDSQTAINKEDIDFMSESTEEVERSDTNTEVKEKFVDIKGAIVKPGVYPIVENMRLNDLIEKAGGFTKEADTRIVNNAMILEDQSLIYIPEKGEIVDVEQSLLSNQSESKTVGKININQADEKELTELSGIGPSKAQAIISYRDENGLFKTIDDLQNVSGFGEKTVERLKDDITT